MKYRRRRKHWRKSSKFKTTFRDHRQERGGDLKRKKVHEHFAFTLAGLP
jgi:hypothetical protein